MLAGIGVSAAHVLPWAILPDAIEWDEYKTGERHEGVFYSLITLMKKMASSVAIPLTAVMLDVTNYVPNAAEQPASALLGIRLLMGPIPAVLLTIAIIFALNIRWTGMNSRMWSEELEERREKRMMGDIEIRQVKTHRENIQQFLTFPWKIYRDDPLWVPPILADRWKTVDPERGVFFQRGTAEFWAAYRDGELVGTICTAIDFKANESVNKKDCVFGFFECINDRDVAFALFDHAKAWAIAHGQDSLYGPFNLDYEDGYGILIEGQRPSACASCAGIRPDYYQGFVEAYGFKPGRGDNLAFERRSACGP